MTRRPKPGASNRRGDPPWSPGGLGVAPTMPPSGRAGAQHAAPASPLLRRDSGVCHSHAGGNPGFVCAWRTSSCAKSACSVRYIINPFIILIEKRSATQSASPIFRCNCHPGPRSGAHNRKLNRALRGPDVRPGPRSHQFGWADKGAQKVDLSAELASNEVAVASLPASSDVSDIAFSTNGWGRGLSTRALQKRGGKALDKEVTECET